MRHIKIVLTLTTLVVIAGVASETSTKKPWEWTDEERIAARFDASAADARRQVSTQFQTTDNAGKIVVDGKRNPELFLPSELMNRLADAYSDDTFERETLRREWIARGALEETFWEKLWAAGRPFFSGWREQLRLIETIAKVSPDEQVRIRRELKVVQQKLCSQRADALAEARRVFGRDSFDRFLYTALAPDMATSGDSTPWEMRTVQAGCR